MGGGEAYYVVKLHENLPVEQLSVKKKKKKSCFKQNQNVPHENVFVLQLATVQRIWSPAALFNDQIQLGEIRHGVWQGGGCCSVSAVQKTSKCFNFSQCRALTYSAIS